MPTPRPRLPETEAALLVLGLLVSEGRRERGWTEQDLAERVGVSAKTLRKVESGDGSVALATAFEAATLVGVPLVAEPEALAGIAERLHDRLAVLPRRVTARQVEVDDDF